MRDPVEEFRVQKIDLAVTAARVVCCDSSHWDLMCFEVVRNIGENLDGKLKCFLLLTFQNHIRVFVYLRVLGVVLKPNPTASTSNEEGQESGKSKLLNPRSKNEVRALRSKIPVHSL